LATNTPPVGFEPIVAPEPGRVRSGVIDNACTKVIEGLKDAEKVITGVELPAVREAASSAGPSPFGGSRSRQ